MVIRLLDEKSLVKLLVELFLITIIGICLTVFHTTKDGMGVTSIIHLIVIIVTNYIFQVIFPTLQISTG